MYLAYSWILLSYGQLCPKTLNFTVLYEVPIVILHLLLLYFTEFLRVHNISHPSNGVQEANTCKKWTQETNTQTQETKVEANGA